jgi:glucose/arabinose dehydrogenase
MKFRHTCFALALSAASFGSGCAAAQSIDQVLASLSLPPGYDIQVYAEVSDVRTLAVAEDLGLVFVGTTGDELKALADRDGDGRAEVVLTVARGLNAPHGITYHEGILYVAERHRVSRYDLRGFGGKLPAPQVLLDGLLDKALHGQRVAVVGADGLLYVAVGTPCNICKPKGFEGSILRLPLTGGAPEIFARGIRNSVGVDVHPKTGVLHFTDNGADNLGDDLPPEELNAAPEAGLHFGYPYFVGGDTRVRIAADAKLLSEVVFPEVTFPAHNAPLGLHFYRGKSLPLAGDALVALHGSWNRSVPDGYRVVRVRFDDNGKAQAWEPFIDGFLQGRRVLGRPVDIKTHWDGSLLITDDYRDLVYRVTYQGE